MKENILIDKSIEFAARIIKLQRYLLKDKKENVIPKQILHICRIFALYYSFFIMHYSIFIKRL